jgi:hypothetical protein
MSIISVPLTLILIFFGGSRSLILLGKSFEMFLVVARSTGNIYICLMLRLHLTCFFLLGQLHFRGRFIVGCCNCCVDSVIIFGLDIFQRLERQ